MTLIDRVVVKQRVACALLSSLLIPLSHGQTVTAAIEEIRPSVVQIGWELWSLNDDAKRRWKEKYGKDARRDEGGSAGTGFIVNLDGYILTASHVIKALRGVVKEFPARHQIAWVITPSYPPGRDDVIRSAGGRQFEVVGEDVEHDLALLKVRTLKEDWIADGYQRVPKAVRFVSQVSEGEQIAVSGYPFRQEDVPQMISNVGWLASGPIWPDALFRSQPGTYRGYLYLADVRANPGNSGGPAYRTRDGAVFGVAVSNFRMHTNVVGIVPTKHIVELLKKHNVSWSSAEESNE